MDVDSIWTMLDNHNKRTADGKNKTLLSDSQTREESKEEEIQIKQKRNDKGMLIEETAIGRTPHGGAYSKVIYMNGGCVLVDKSVAKKMHCMEFDKDGKLIYAQLLHIVKDNNN